MQAGKREVYARLSARHMFVQIRDVASMVKGPDNLPGQLETARG